VRHLCLSCGLDIVCCHCVATLADENEAMKKTHKTELFKNRISLLLCNYNLWQQKTNQRLNCDFSLMPEYFHYHRHQQHALSVCPYCTVAVRITSECHAGRSWGMIPGNMQTKTNARWMETRLNSICPYKPRTFSWSTPVSRRLLNCSMESTPDGPSLQQI